MRTLALIALAALAGCAPAKNAETDNALDAAMNALDEAANAVANADAPGASSAAQEGWIYTSNSDPMSDEKTELACVQSSNTIHLSFPYGPTGAQLCLRNSPQFGRDAYVSLNEDGQILCQSYESCTIQVRFDKQAADPWSAIGPSDNSSDMIFIEDRENFERNVRTAKITNIQLEFYQNGMQTFTFNTAGLKWGRKEIRSANDPQGE